jgi:glutathione S-transferase
MTVIAASCTIVGRSSSSFTRVSRIFAAELGVPYTLEVVRDLQSLEVEAYGGNPALKVPSLRTPSGTWFGALNICRELARISLRALHVVWPEVLERPLLANMQELTLHAMATEVGLIMSGPPAEGAETPSRVKMRLSLHNTLSWLDAHATQALDALPAERQLSYLETCLFCLVTHLEFRNVLPTAPYPTLVAFSQRFGGRASCTETAFRFDP